MNIWRALFLAAGIAGGVGAAGGVTLDPQGVFTMGDLCLRVDPAGDVEVVAGGSSLGQWKCLVELEGDTQCRSAAALLKNARRTVSPEQGRLVVEGDILALDGRTILRYAQRMTALGDGVSIEVAVTTADGKDAMHMMQSRRRPFGLMTLEKARVAGGSWKAVDAAGKEFRGQIAVAAPAVQLNYVPTATPVVEMIQWTADNRYGVSIRPGNGCFVELVDLRFVRGPLRFNVHPDTDRSAYSQVIRSAGPCPLPPCTFTDVTLPAADHAYLFPADRDAEVRLRVVNNREEAIKPVVTWTLEPWTAGTPVTGRMAVRLGARQTRDVTIPLDLPRRDLYRFTARAAVGDQDCGTVRFGLGSMVPVPAVTEAAPSHFGQQGRLMPGAAQLGLKWFLPAFPGWQRLEPEKGKFDWAEADDVMAYMRTNAMTAIITLYGAPLWASSLRDVPDFDAFTRRYADDRSGFENMVLASGGLRPMQVRFENRGAHMAALPADWEDYRRYIEALVSRYGDQIRYVAVGNEADGCNSYFGSPREYVECLKQTRAILDAVAPDVKILGIGSYSYTPTPFARAMFAAGAARYMDIYHWHPYYEANGWALHAREQFALWHSHAPGKPGWCTEFGNPAPPKVDSFPMSEAAYDTALAQTAGGKPPSKFFTLAFGANLSRAGGKLTFYPNGPACMPEPEQARSLARFYASMLSEGVEVFTLHSGTPLVAENSEPFLAALVQAKASATLAQATPVRALASSSPSFRGYLFQTPDGPVAVCWTTSEKETVALRNIARSAVLTDLYGNPQTMNRAGGAALLPLTPAPVYLHGVGMNMAVASPTEGVMITAPAAVAPGDRVPLSVRLTNAWSASLSVRLMVMPPAEWKIAVPPVERTVAPGMALNETVELTVPPAAFPGPCTVGVELQSRAGALQTAALERKTLLVIVPTPCSPAPPGTVIDGDLAEWQDRESLKIDRMGQIVWQTDELLSQFNRLWRGPDDLSARLWYAWQADALLVAMDVRDESVQLFTSPPGREYQGDAVELFFDGRGSAYRPEYGKGVYQMIWVPPTRPGDSGRLAEPQGADGVQAAGRRTTSGYTLELRLPLTETNFPGFKSVPGAIFGATVALDDMDAGMGASRKIQMALSGSARNHADTSAFLRLRFDEHVYRTNLITNGGFEEGSPLPAGWKVVNGRQERGSAVEGEACLALARAGQAGGTARQRLALEPATWYALAFAYRVNGAAGVSGLQVEAAGPEEAFRAGVYLLGECNSVSWSRGLTHFYSGRGGPADCAAYVYRKPMAGADRRAPEATLRLDGVELRKLTEADTAGELVENGGFEEGAAGSVPPGWSRGTVAIPPEVTVSEREAHTGKRSMEITLAAAQDIAGLDTFAQMSGSRRLLPGQPYVLSFWVKTDRPCTLNAGVSGAGNAFRRVLVTTEWAQSEVPILLSTEEAAAVRLDLPCRLSFEGALKSGPLRLWIDDVSLRAQGSR